MTTWDSERERKWAREHAVEFKRIAEINKQEQQRMAERLLTQVIEPGQTMNFEQAGAWFLRECMLGDRHDPRCRSKGRFGRYSEGCPRCYRLKQKKLIVTELKQLKSGNVLLDYIPKKTLPEHVEYIRSNGLN